MLLSNYYFLNVLQPYSFLVLSWHLNYKTYQQSNALCDCLADI